MVARTLLTAILVTATPAASAIAQQDHAVHEHQGQPGDRTAPATPSKVDTLEKPDEHPMRTHGGTLHQFGNLQAEVVVEPGSLRLFVYDHEGQPVDLKAAKGLATVQVQGNAKRYRYDLFPEIRKDQTADTLTVAVDLRRIAGQPVEIEFQLVGVAGAERRPASFSARTIAPMTEQQRVAAAIATQKTCPVSGHPLGSMGDPIPVTIGEHTIYVCCAGCIDTVKANPAKYLAKKPKLKVAPATEADAVAIALQKLCPVTDEPLDAMGGPYKTVIDGQIVYICCPGCAKKLHANPTVFLTKLQEQGVTPPEAR